MRDLFTKSRFNSIKYSNFFSIYEHYLTPFVGKKVTLVEVGVFHGGSLEMFKNFLGSNARIIGVDLEPRAKELENHGYEIFIGDSSDSNFWSDFYSQVGEVDVLIDDGGHTNMQQIMCLISNIQLINDGGVIVIEDTYHSFNSNFGNPHPFSFMNFTKKLASLLTTRTSRETQNPLINRIRCISFFERLVVFEVSRREDSVLLSNGKETRVISDYRFDTEFRFLAFLRKVKAVLSGEYQKVGNRYERYARLNSLLNSLRFRKFLQLLLPVRVILSVVIFVWTWTRNFYAYKAFRALR